MLRRGIQFALAFCGLAGCLLAYPEAAGSIHGTVVDNKGDVCEGAHVALTQATGSSAQPRTAISDGEGRYGFDDVPAGSFTVTVTANGFSTQTVSGVLHAGESIELKPVALAIIASTQVQVTADIHDIAQAQVALQEQQRILGVVPNFYVSYAKDPAPLTPHQKFQLAARSEIDPVTILFDAAGAGVEQAENSPASWGQGGTAYAKRFAAAYGDDLIDTMLGGAVFPSIFHQDPRYFYKGTGTKTSRVLYAIRSAVICRGDNGHWQFNYSSFLGDFAASGISEAYYPADVRTSFSFIAGHIFLGKAIDAGQNIVQEFIIPHFTPRFSRNNASQLNATQP
jgi:hypothetical protein